MAAPAPSTGEQQLFSQPNFAEIYERALVGPLFRPWVADLLDGVELAAGDRVLDVACGTGIVARLAKERLGPAGAAVGVDLNPEMLAVARRAAPALDWRLGDVEALPLHAAERFDVVLCQQGFQFFQNRLAAAREMRRALSEGGRLGLSFWRADHECPLLQQLREIAQRHIGPVSDRRYSLGTPEPAETALREAGFRDIRSRQVYRRIRFTDGGVFLRLNAMALLSMSATATTLDDAARERTLAAIVDDSAALAAHYSDEAGLSYETGTNLVLARV